MLCCPILPNSALLSIVRKVLELSTCANITTLRANESWSQGHPRTKLGSSVGQPHSNHGSPRQVVPRMNPMQVHPRRTPGAPQVHPSRPHPGVIPTGHTLGPTPPGCMQDDPCGDYPRVCPRGAPRILWGWPTDQLWMGSAGASQDEPGVCPRVCRAAANHRTHT